MRTRDTTARRMALAGALGGALILGSAAPAAAAPADAVQVYAPIKTERGAFHANAKGTVTPGGHAATVFLGRIPFTGQEAGPGAADLALRPPSGNSTASVLPAGTIQGLGVGFPGFTVQYAPSDANAALSPNHIVEWVNAAYAIYDRGTTGATPGWAGPFAGNTPWQGFGGGCEANNDGDPIIKYDAANNVWIYTQFSVSTKPYLQCFAISAKGDPTTVVKRFAYSFGSTDFPDYPKMGIWPGGYFMTFNIFRNGFSYRGPRLCTVDSAAALAPAGTPGMLCYQLSSSTGSVLPADLDGPTPPPAGSPNYLFAYASNSLQVWKFTPNFATTSASKLAGPTTLGVLSFSRACSGGTCIPQPGTSQKLDSLADRLMYRAAYRNHGGVQSIVLNHSVTPGNGAASGIRWYEVRVSSTGGLSVAQQGTYAPDTTTARWMGSAAMNGAGTIAIGYNASSGSVPPSIRFAARCGNTSAPSGALQAETRAVDGGGSQLTNLNRWGDYASMVVDPADDATFWFTTQYLQQSGTFNWSTAIVPIRVAC